MRVITGSARGKKLEAPIGLNTRPTTDRVKESVFNIIQSRLPANNILDLFAGSGAMGIEALSRGSKHAVFVDCDKSAISVINHNLEGTRLSDKANVINSSANDYLNICKEKFDIIFLDPPYNRDFLNNIVFKIVSDSILDDDGIIVVESELGGEEITLDSVECIKSAKYGKTVISILRKRDLN